MYGALPGPRSSAPWKKRPKYGSETEHVEVVAAHLVHPRSRETPVASIGGVEPRLIGGEGRQSVEAANAIAEIDIVRVGLGGQVIAGALDREERLFVRQTERAKNEAVDGPEHDRVRANGDGKRDDGRDREARRFPQLAYAEAEIADKGVEQTAGECIAGLFLEACVSTELHARLAFGRDPLESRALEVVGAMQDVRAQLVLELAFERVTMKNADCQRAEICEHAHAPSGRARRASAMAATRRFQLSVSSPSRFRPGTVSS